MAQYKDGQYWRKEQDAFMAIVFTGDSTTKEWNAAYYAVLPRLRKMGESILRRYFGYADNRVVDDLVMDAITIIITTGNYYPEKPKLYAYLGTIFKRYFYDKFIKKYRESQNALLNADTNYDVSDDEWLLDDFATPPEDEFDYNERQEMLERILSHFKTCIAKVDAEYHIINNHGTELVKRNEILDREMKWLLCAREYFEKYFLDSTVDSMGLAEYCYANLSFPAFTQLNISKKYMGIGSNIEKFNSLKSVNEKSFKEYGLSFEMDDYSPNEYPKKRSYRKKNGKNSQYSYY